MIELKRKGRNVLERGSARIQENSEESSRMKSKIRGNKRFSGEGWESPVLSDLMLRA